MDIKTLCNQVDLQAEIKNKVLAFAEHFDFTLIEKQLNSFLIYENMEKSRKELQTILGTDHDRIKMLACMLKASADAWEIYQEKGICDEIYFSTMKCYTRFIDETYQRTGRLYFDRDWWTTRQAGCHLFRIGTLEYEMNRHGNETDIELHIPSDADFSPSAVDRSLKNAGTFFRKYYPETGHAKYCCHSWLLDSQLRKMLTAESNIIRFQNRFTIYDAGEADPEFVEWVFPKNAADQTDYAAFPEDTSLRRNMKKHLLSGGIIRSSCGMLKTAP